MKQNKLLLPSLFFFFTGAAFSNNYYLTTFGVQDKFNSFAGAHTFAVFVEEKDKREMAVLDKVIISWLPKAGVVKMFFPPEAGRNYEMVESIEEALNRGAKVSYWGPFLVNKELYERAKKQADFLNGGGRLYQAVDNINRPLGIAINCEHAVSDVDVDNGLIQTGTSHGNIGTYHVTKHLEKWFLSKETFPVILEKLGIAHYPMKKMDLAKKPK